MGRCVPAEGAQVPGDTEWDRGGFTKEGRSRACAGHAWHMAETNVMSVEASGWVELDPCGALMFAAPQRGACAPPLPTPSPALGRLVLVPNHHWSGTDGGEKARGPQTRFLVL